MSRVRFLSLVLLVMTALALGARGEAAGFDVPQEEEVVDDRPEVEELLERLAQHTGRQGKEDPLAVRVIGELRAQFARSGPHDRRDIAKALYRTMKVKRRTSKDGHRLRELFFVSARALGEMGPESVEYLIRLIDDRNHRDDYEVRTRVLAALGRTRDERAVGPLLDVLDEFQARLQAAAASALGDFEVLDQKIRKRAFEELLKLLTGTRSALDSDPDSSTLRDRWNRIAGPCQNSMRRLSGAEVSGPSAWRRWWNKNKRRSWDENPSQNLAPARSAFPTDLPNDPRHPRHGGTTTPLSSSSRLACGGHPDESPVGTADRAPVTLRVRGLQPPTSLSGGGSPPS